MSPAMEKAWALATMEFKPVKKRPLGSRRIKGGLSKIQFEVDTPFGEWKVKGPTYDWSTVSGRGNETIYPYTLCECSCGVRREVNAYRLKDHSSRAKSCGKPECSKKARDGRL